MRVLGMLGETKQGLTDPHARVNHINRVVLQEFTVYCYQTPQ